MLDALGDPLYEGDLVVFVHKTAHTFQTRGAPRYVKARIVGFTEKMIIVEWLEVQKLAGYNDLKEPPYTGRWLPKQCVKLNSEPNPSL